MTYLVRRAFAVAVWLLYATGAGADLVSPYGGETAANFAEIKVLDDRVHVALEIDLSDYPIFVAKDDGSGQSLAERTGRTLTITADGVDIEPTTRLVDVRQRKPRVSSARKSASAAPRERSEEIVYVELDFPFAGQPKTLTLTPPLEADGMPAASVGMLVAQRRTGHRLPLFVSFRDAHSRLERFLVQRLRESQPHPAPQVAADVVRSGRTARGSP